MTDILEIHEITVERVAVTQGTAGGQVRTYSTSNRSGNPIKVIGRAIRMTEKEKLDHGVRGDFTGWKFLVPDEDPKVALTDRVTFEYLPGDTTTSHTVKITHSSFLRANETQKLYKFLGEEDTSES